VDPEADRHHLTCEAAAAERDRLSVPVLDDPRDGGVYTVVDWLETWVETRARLRDSTRRMYQGHIRLYFHRLLDGVLLRELHIGHVQDAFQRLFDEGMTATTARRLFSTLRSALNAAVREQLIRDNPARYLKLPKGRRPFAVVWTKRRVQEWRRTGERPVVAVWTPAQLAQFLSVGSIGVRRKLPARFVICPGSAPIDVPDHPRSPGQRPIRPVRADNPVTALDLVSSAGPEVTRSLRLVLGEYIDH
jgi:hypothetical protein